MFRIRCAFMDWFTLKVIHEVRCLQANAKATQPQIYKTVESEEETTVYHEAKRLIRIRCKYIYICVLFFPSIQQEVNYNAFFDSLELIGGNDQY